jgi:hypothetical protein
MMRLIPPMQGYDRENEAAFRDEARRADGENMKPLVAVPSFIMLNQNGEPYRITLVGSTLTVTAV